MNEPTTSPAKMIVAALVIKRTRFSRRLVVRIGDRIIHHQAYHSHEALTT